MQSKLDQLKQRVKGQSSSKADIATEFFILAKELSCLGDLLGREYEFVYKTRERKVLFWKFRFKKLTGFKQLPIKIPTFITLLDELEAHIKREAKAMKDKKGRR